MRGTKNQIKSAQRWTNLYVSMRDRDLPCISCGSFGARFTAGHYRTVAAAGSLRFDLDNIHKQCVACNFNKSGNIVKYREALLDKIGLDRVEKIEMNNLLKIWQAEELGDIVKQIKAKIKQEEIGIFF